jgi:hypothetical protein
VVADTGDDHTADILKSKLSEILDQPRTLSEQLVEYIVRKQIQQQVVNAVVRGTADTGRNKGLQWSVSTDQVALDKFVDTVIYELGLAKNLGKTQIADVLDRFGAIFERNKRVLGKNQMHFIARESIRSDIESLVFGLGPLEDLLKLPDITEIMVVGKNLRHLARPPCRTAATNADGMVVDSLSRAGETTM